MSKSTDYLQSLADPENANGMAPDWIAEGLTEGWKYTLSTRQRVAFYNTWVVVDGIGDHVLDQEHAIPLIQAELSALLADAGLRGPHYKPGERDHPLLHDAYEALLNCKSWNRYLRAGDARRAAASAFRVCNFVGRVLLEACQSSVERRWNQDMWGKRGGRTNAERAKPRHEKWQRMLEDAARDDPYCKSYMHLCRGVALNAGKNPATRKPWTARAIFDATTNPIKRNA